MSYHRSQSSNKSTYNSRSADKFVIRLPDGMREHLSNIAREEKASMNTMIIKALEAAYPQDPTLQTYTPVEGMALVHKETGHIHVLKGVRFEFNEIWFDVEQRLKDETIPATYPVHAFHPLIITS